MGNLDFSANADQLKELATYIASQINVPTIGIGGGYAPIGTIISVMGTTAPQDYLACDGTVYNIADYPQLADYFESQFGESNHFGGNGTTTFAVPDLQGEFLRGTGTNSHANQGSGANVGVHQDGTEFPNIGQAYNGIMALNRPSTDGILITNVDASRKERASGKSTNILFASEWSDTVDNVMIPRPTNTSVLYCIKAVVEGGESSRTKYSTDEQVIGEWIDGKPIYQKTFVLSKRTIASNTSIALSEFQELTDIENIIGCNIYKNGTVDSCGISKSGTSLVFYPSTSLSDITTFTFQYTKTSFQIVSWADGTDAEIAAMVEAADAGLIQLEDYWSVGDERTVSLSAMEATGVGESHSAQTATLVLMDKNNTHYKYVTPPESGETNCRFIVGLKNCLDTVGYMNSEDTAQGGWGSTKREIWCNDIFRNAIPAELKPIFKQVAVEIVTSWPDGKSILSNDYFFFPTEKEVFGTNGQSPSAEAGKFTQWDYYKTAGNRSKKSGDSGLAVAWWDRSQNNYQKGFCFVNSDGTMNSTGGIATITNGISPAGCI